MSRAWSARSAAARTPHPSAAPSVAGRSEACSSCERPSETGYAGANKSCTGISSPGGSRLSRPSSDSRLDHVAGPALVMDRHAVIGVEDEIMRDAGQREIARELRPMIARCCPLGENFDHDHGLGNFDRSRRQARPAIDQSVRLERGARRDAHRRAIGNRVASRIGAPDRGFEGDERLGFGVEMRQPLRRLRHELAVLQFPSPVAPRGGRGPGPPRQAEPVASRR